MLPSFWSDHAVLVCWPKPSENGFTRIVEEGPLLHVVQSLIATESTTLETMRLSLPDRGIAPFSYTGPALADLIRLSTRINL